MPKPDPHFSHLSRVPREEDFERLHKCLSDMETYVPLVRQNPFWKAVILHQLKFEEWAASNGWVSYMYPEVEGCFESALRELGAHARIALLDPRLQIEVVDVDGVDCPTWACQVHRHEWIKRFVEVRPATRILLLLSQRAIERLPKEDVMEDLRHELGHVLLYLREPEAGNECSAADEEWERGTQMEDFIG